MTDSYIAAFEEFVSDENMRLAWKRLTHSMRKEVKDRLGLQAYAPQLEKHIQILQDSLRSAFSPSKAYPLFKTKQDRSHRRFSFLSMDDRFVYQAICNILIKNSYDHIFNLWESQRLFSNIPTHPRLKSPYTFRRVFTSKFGDYEGQFDRYRRQVLQSRKDFLAKHPDSWVVRTDVRSYFPSINHCELLKILECKGWLPDERMRDILKRCLAKWHDEAGHGIPIGYECSDLIGNLFLVSLDEALSDFTVHRYVDDIYIFVEGFEEAKQAIFLIDKALAKLALQRNTLKTEFLSLSELCEDELRRRLTESLSQIAHQEPTEESENQRQRQLLGILHGEFGSDFGKLNLKGEFENISRVAFALYRLRLPNGNVRRLAYSVLDHFPNYALHAMKYLFEVYRDDPALESKLKMMVEAAYEGNDVKHHALKYLKVIDDGQESVRFIGATFTHMGTDNWHIPYAVIRDVLQRNESESYTELLRNAATSLNPFISTYAVVVLCALIESKERRVLVNELLGSESFYKKKVALYLAHRYRIKVESDKVPEELERLMDTEQVEEMQYFHKAFLELFQISLESKFPIQKYFGAIGVANQMLRDIELHMTQGIDDFIVATRDLLYRFFHFRARVIEQHPASREVDFPDDDELTSLINNLEPKSDGTHKWKNGKQTFLLDQLRRVMPKYLMEVQEKEGLIVRDKIFISYSADDKEWRKMLVKAIHSYFGQSPPLWYFEGNLKFSDAIRQEIIDARSETKVAILLTSNNYFASKPVMELEYPYFKEQRDRNNLKILWIPCEPSSADLHGLGDVWTPAGKEPLTGKIKHDRKNAFDHAARELYEYFHPNDSKSGS